LNSDASPEEQARNGFYVEDLALFEEREDIGRVELTIGVEPSHANATDIIDMIDESANDSASEKFLRMIWNSRKTR
jgi:hypothetical protein